MNKNIASKLWFFAAICFMLVGVLDKNILYVVLACSYVCIGFSKIKKK